MIHINDQLIGSGWLFSPSLGKVRSWSNPLRSPIALMGFISYPMPQTLALKRGRIMPSSMRLSSSGLLGHESTHGSKIWGKPKNEPVKRVMMVANQ